MCVIFLRFDRGAGLVQCNMGAPLQSAVRPKTDILRLPAAHMSNRPAHRLRDVGMLAFQILVIVSVYCAISLGCVVSSLAENPELTS